MLRLYSLSSYGYRKPVQILGLCLRLYDCEVSAAQFDWEMKLISNDFYPFGATVLLFLRMPEIIRFHDRYDYGR